MTDTPNNTDPVPLDVKAPGMTPQARQFASEIVDQVRNLRRAIDTWRSEHFDTGSKVKIIDYRIEEAWRCLRSAESHLARLVDGRDPELATAIEAFTKAFPAEDDEQKPQVNTP